MKLVLLPTLSFLFYRAYGKSGLPEACLGGSCSFEVEESPTSLGGIIELSGSSSAISDITPTAGWQILNCTDSTNSQAIRLVCEDESKGCAHLFQNGAQDTVIRLPDDCGSGPFVRVADHWVPDDQSLPSELASKLRRRDGTIPQVHMLQIDDDFNQTSSLQGPISFNFRAQGDHHVAAASVGRQRKRQGITTGNASETQTVNTNNSPTFILFKDILSCNTEDEVITGELEALLDVDTSFTIEVFVLVSGTVMPLEIFAFQFDAPTSASITGSFSQFATLQGTVSGEPLPLLSVDFNSLTIPGLATINPSFSITATPSGFVQDQPNFQSRINFNIQIDNLEFTYPANFTPATVEVSRPNLPMGITVTTSPSANAMASFGIDIVHQLSVEITAFNLPGVVNVNYELVQNVTLAANPTLEGINVNACLAVENGVTMNIFSTGDLFDALRAKDFLFYEDEVEQLPSFCTESGLSPTPPAALQERATLIERDTVECPAPAATAIPAIVFQKPA